MRDYKSNYFGQDFDDAVAWVKSNATRVLQQITILTAKVGDLSKLLTKNKTSAVDAINEIYTQGGGGGRVDTEMSDTSTNAVQNNVIKSYVDSAFDKTNILNVRMQDEVDSHFDNYSVVNIMDGSNLVATILLNTHSQSTKGILFQHGAGWKLVTEELGDIIGAGWSQVLDDMDNKSVTIGGGGGDDDDSTQKLLASQTHDLIYENLEGKLVLLKDNTLNGQSMRRTDAKKLWCARTISMSYSFYGCKNIEEVFPYIIAPSASKITSMSNAFNGCNKLSKIDLSKTDLSECIDFSGAFNACYMLPKEAVDFIDFSSATNLNNLFSGCRSFKSFTIDASSATTIANLFHGCSSLLYAKIVISSACNNISQIFRDCTSLIQADLTEGDYSGVTTSTLFVYGPRNLKSLIGLHTLEEVENGEVVAMRGMRTSFALNDYAFPDLQRASLLALIKGLADMSSAENPLQLKMGSVLKARLTSNDIAIATAKNWTIL